MNKLTTALSAAALLSMSCYNIQIVNGKPLGTPAIGYEEKLHFGVLAGIVELGGNYNLDQICPNGWAEASSSLTIIAGILNYLVPVIAFQSIRITCTGGGAYKLQMNEDGSAKVLDIIEQPTAQTNAPSAK
jgi:hypothetical protein